MRCVFPVGDAPLRARRILAGASGFTRQKLLDIALRYTQENADVLLPQLIGPARLAIQAYANPRAPAAPRADPSTDNYKTPPNWRLLQRFPLISNLRVSMEKGLFIYWQ